LELDNGTKFGKWQVEVEEAMKSLHAENMIDLVILRCPHIYGTPKEKTIDRYRDGTMIVMGTGMNVMQHIHYHDYVQGLALASGLLSSGRPPSGDYNLVDDTTETYADYCKFITDWCRQPPSQPMSLEDCIQTGRLKDLLGPAFGKDEIVKEIFIPLGFSAMFDNSKVKEDLGLVLKYPTFRHGLAALMLAMDWDKAGWKDGSVFTDSQVRTALDVDGGYSNPHSKDINQTLDCAPKGVECIGQLDPESKAIRREEVAASFFAVVEKLVLALCTKHKTIPLGTIS
jgi:hypothetical protein